MTIKGKDGSLVRFGKPDENGIVKVNRILPDGEELIGQIYPDYSNEDYVTYVSTNEQGEEILPPTFDFNEIERSFVRYANELSERSIQKEAEEREEELMEREEMLRSIRQMKNKNLGLNQTI